METQSLKTEMEARAETPDSVVAQTSPRNWFAAYTHSHHEKRVAQHFGQRQIESFLPLYSVTRRWKNGCRMILDLPLFPNYVFVQILRRDRVSVLEVPEFENL